MKKNNKFSNTVVYNIQQSLNNLIKINSKKYIKLIHDAAQVCIGSIEKNNKILFCGNGGSAADSQHLCAELVSKFLEKRKPYPSIALTTNASILTSIGNDFGYDLIFSKQIESIGRKGDVLIAISTSGKSKNVIKAMIAAKKIGIKVIFLTGEKIFNKEYADIIIDAPAKRVDRIQELHIHMGHTICELIEKKIL